MDALKPERPEVQSFVNSNFKFAGLPCRGQGPCGMYVLGTALTDTSSLGLRGLTVLQAHR